MPPIAENCREILVTGSLAFDHIMDFPGRFSDHILPDKLHILNVSFLVNKLKRQWGGTAGNIAYNLALLGESPLVLAAAGKDFLPYRRHLIHAGVNLSAVREYQSDLTPTFFVVTDRDDNQLAGFYLGAMGKARRIYIKNYHRRIRLAIISPNDPQAMVSYTRECREYGIPFIFDPGQQIPRLSEGDIKISLKRAMVLIGNDYEVELIRRKTGWSDLRILENVEVLVTTLGKKGSIIRTRGEVLRIPSVKVKKTIDPTGAGDAYRAGLIKGLIEGWTLEKTGKAAATAASFAVEKYGTQEHYYTLDDFIKRYEKNFGKFFRDS